MIKLQMHAHMPVHVTVVNLTRLKLEYSGANFLIVPV